MDIFLKCTRVQNTYMATHTYTYMATYTYTYMATKAASCDIPKHLYADVNPIQLVQSSSSCRSACVRLTS